jgi:WD40 repeat protein
MKRREFLSASLLALAATRVHAARGWKVVREYRHPGDINVEQVELSRDGQFLASWATDGSLALWNVRNNNQLLTRA